MCPKCWRVLVLGGKLPEDWMQPKLVLLDVGMVTRLSTADQQNMVKLFQSLLGMDGQGIADAVLSFSGKLTQLKFMHALATAALTQPCCCGEVICDYICIDAVHCLRQHSSIICYGP